MVFTCLVNNSSVVQSIKIGQSKTGITKENNKEVDTKCKNRRYIHQISSPAHVHTHKQDWPALHMKIKK